MSITLEIMTKNDIFNVKSRILTQFNLKLMKPVQKTIFFLSKSNLRLPTSIMSPKTSNFAIFLRIERETIRREGNAYIPTIPVPDANATAGFKGSIPSANIPWYSFRFPLYPVSR